MGVVFGSYEENKLLLQVLLLHIFAICSVLQSSPLLNDLSELGSLFGTGPSLLQTVVDGATAVSGGGATAGTVSTVTTVPAVTTVMDPPMMAPTILPVIFAVAVIKALILERMKDKPKYPSHSSYETDYGYSQHGYQKRRKFNRQEPKLDIRLVLA